MTQNNVYISPEEIQLQRDVINSIKVALSQSPACAMVETYGCQQNVNDSQRIEGMLLDMGFTLTDNRNQADVIIFNTCAIRENAQSRVYGNLGALKHLKEKKPSLIIGICGCMVQQEHIAKRIRSKYRHVDMIFGTHTLWKFPSLLSEVMEKREKILDISGSGVIAEGLPVNYDGGVKAFVSVMYGCNNFCSYCIVPYVRGRERSRREEDILSEIESLAETGVKEVMLLGQNVNSYGKDRGETDAFAKLLEKVCRIDGIERIRFMSSHPKDISPLLLRTMAEQEKICKQLHLPLQSGSDKVLKDMNRVYDREKYLETVRLAKELMPDIGLTTDIIVGFPTETQEDFLDTLSLLEEVEYDSIFSFIYSRRDGTRAAQMESVASEEEIDARFQELLRVQNDISARRNIRHEGRIETVLVEGQSKTDPQMLTGRNYANKIVNFKGDESLIGTFTDVKITKAQTWILYGELV
ncbi:MAG: tRNA (N6-isopentenyl adenosine(37)-C2)-methylthiotransferase MiaB [Ruminococcaceae bacterium]|nr:tRNA (N6-isopentenyl adenosine(37)-C2)-methylthiotransferase MiaB [Oscillospiraceae bacterium]